MSLRSQWGWRGWWLAVLLGAVGCGGTLVEESLPGEATEESSDGSEVSDVPEASEDARADCAPQCAPAFKVQNSPVLSPYPYPSVLTPLRNRVYFLAPISDGGPTGLWRSDATGAGTYPILSDVSGPLMKAGELLYFFRSGNLWVSDGTTHGSRKVKSFAGRQFTGVYREVHHRLFFAIWDMTDSRRELWVSDGSKAGTRLVASFPDVAYSLSSMAEFRGRLFFVAATEAAGMELWMSDGTPGGTQLFKDIAPGAADSSPSQLTVVGDDLYFIADDQIHGAEVWTAQSLNPARTFMVRDFVPGASSSYARLLGGLHGDLYVMIHPADQFSDLELWRTDGSSRGSVLVKRFVSPNPTYTEFWSPQGLAVGNLLYFIVQPLSTMGPGAGNAQLWRTDGSTAGTLYLTEPLTYGDEGPITELFAVDKTLLFAALDNVPYGDPGQHGRELWKSTGTASSTRLLQDIRPGPDWSNPSSFVRSGRYVYFLAEDPSRYSRLWALPVESVKCSRPLEAHDSHAVEVAPATE